MLTQVLFYDLMAKLHIYTAYCFTTKVALQVSTAEEIISHFEGEPADLVICDGAPDGMYFLHY